jgi:hypothetical protein
MAKYCLFLISTIAIWSIYVSAGPIGDRPTTTIATSDLESSEATTLASTSEVAIRNETGVIDTLTTETEIEVAGGNETHIRQKRSCGCCCCR